MASMSYCMFENTSIELDQVVGAMEEAMTWEDLDLNSYERTAKEKLFDLCEQYISLYTKLDEMEEDDM